MNIQSVRTKKDYQAALARLEIIFDAKPGTQEGDELEILGTLIDQYEQENYPMDYQTASKVSRLTELLLGGPVFTDRQIKAIREARKSINQWRIKPL